MLNEIFIIAGARPNFMKIAPLIKEFSNQNINFKLVHTGQHNDYNMSKIFFDNLRIPNPNVHLNIGSASHAVQTAKIMIEFEKVLYDQPPKLVIVVGDVNSTLACALVAKKRFIKVGHVEAGLRSFDMDMPEEINRLLTDQISDLLFTTEKSAEINLKKEGIRSDKIFFVGNIMIDTLIMNLKKAEQFTLYKEFNLEKNQYALLTLHRPANVDNKENLEKIMKIIDYIQEKISLIFPVHPRTQKKLKEFNFESELQKKNVILSEPVGYLEFLNLMLNSKFIATDSGGIQEEASYLNIPVLTLRKNTERPITVDLGTNTVVGNDYNKAKVQIDRILSNKYKKARTIDKWDGNTAIRITNIIKEKFFSN